MDSVIIASIVSIIVAIINGIFGLLQKIKRFPLQKFLVIMITLTIVLSGIAAGILFVSFPAAVKITYPRAADGVDSVVNVQGTSQNIPNGDVIWIVIYVQKNLLYYPMISPAVVQKTGEWTSGATIGGPNDSNDRFDIIAVLADQTTQEAFNAYNANSKNNNFYPGIDKLPVNAEIEHRITVVRNNNPNPSPTPTVSAGPTPTSGPTSITITFPTNGSTASDHVTAQGTSQNIPSGQAIWAIVFVHSISYYYPMPAAAILQQTGSWQTPVTLGGANDTGLSFDILMVLANQAGQSSLVNYNQDAETNHPSNYPGLAELPAGLTVYSNVTIIRSP